MADNTLPTFPNPKLKDKPPAQDVPTVFELRDGGQKPRLVRFFDPEISIGFAPTCQLPLEPQDNAGAKLTLSTLPDLPCVLRVVSGPNLFSLNGLPIATEVPVKSGDVISIHQYRILVESLPPRPEVQPPAEVKAPEDPATLTVASTIEPEKSAVEPVEEMAADATKAATSPVPAVKQTTVPKAPPGLEYLYLFFAPVQEYLKDDDVSEIMINGPRQIYVERKGKLQAIAARFPTEESLQAAVINVARSVGRLFDRDNPRLDARLPDGSRVHAVMPPVARRGTTVAIRKFRRDKLTLQQLVEYGSISKEGAELLNAVVKLGKNLIVSGATSSGKTSVLNVLSALIPEDERILVLEDSSELQLQQVHTVCFETRKADEYGKGEVTIRDLLHSTLRLRPDRIVVGEIRGGEALDLLQAMNTGHDGSMSTIHANAPRDCLLRLETCSLFSGIDMPLAALREQVASAIHVVIQTARLHDGSRKITAVTEVLGLKEGQYQLQPIMVYKQEDTFSSGKIKGQHVFTGYRPSFMDSAKRHGLEIEGLFPS